jgi:hypothetical protein
MFTCVTRRSFFALGRMQDAECATNKNSRCLGQQPGRDKFGKSKIFLLFWEEVM